MVVHQLRYTFLYFFANDQLSLHFLHFTTLFRDQILHFQYAIFLDSDLTLSLHLVHFRYTHYALLHIFRYTFLHSGTFPTLSETKSYANGTLFS
jgi:hypothetical protein